MTTDRKPHNWQGTEVPIPQILLFADPKWRDGTTSRAPMRKMSTSGIKVPLVLLPQNFKIGALWSHQNTRGGRG